MLMKRERSMLIGVFFCFLFLFLATRTVSATCPLCVGATASMVATARFFGVNDLITGTFIGALIVSTAAWINRVLTKRNKGRNYLPFQQIILVVFWLLAFTVIFFIAGLIKFELFNRLVIGMLMGVFIVPTAFIFNKFLRENNGRKNYMPFQHIFLTIVFLLIAVFAYYVIGVV